MTKEQPLFIDSHIAVWLYDGMLDRFNNEQRQILNTHAIIAPAAMMLELQYWYGAKKISDKPMVIIDSLSRSIGLMLSSTRFDEIAYAAIQIGWTRDPFDKMLLADAMVHHAKFMTANPHIRANYELAVWG